ncbi:hypothetical protein KUG85_14425 [Nitratireductor sp. L1-7-SE]|uniref:Uncharacterized protein n=1 Tax=Nitratireductor rhodophyticola TaxID=2854036 RepID=A0ABS7RAM4_9HYPH|nr:hypothetical protein [Nitratireductor rhodophyticola]MBY8916538.1 hypothetical protein [Nitratireductor rhodophyticola]MBY8921902.1 hypothetical protein [Nitratireductor rhodophyticola]
MARVRSPNYPQVDLASALAMARKLFDKDGRNKIPQLALASHLGHDSLSGPALGKIGALRAYGVVEGTGDENRVSEEAITALMAPEESSEKSEALQRMALRPPLFSDISKEFPTPPSDSNLKYWLVKRGFSSEAATKAARTYLATIALVTVADRDCDSRSSPDDDGEIMQAVEPHRQTRQSRSGQVAGGGWPVAPQGMRREIVALDEGDVTISFPENLSSDSFADLEDHLRIFIRKMQRRVRPTANIIEDDEGAGDPPKKDDVFD